jgi:hypothetical protein
VVHKAKKIDRDTERRDSVDQYVKVPIVRFWHHGNRKWLFTYSSMVHRDPRLGLQGSEKTAAGLTHYKLIFIQRGVDVKAQELRATDAEALLSGASGGP